MKILVNDTLAKEAIELLEKEHQVTARFHELDDLIEVIDSYDGILVRSATKLHDERIFRRASKLKVIGRAGVGVDNIDVKTATELGIPVVFAPTGAMISVAELTLAHMLALSRNIVRATNTMKNGKWEKSHLKGRELHGKTLGLVGCGNIGHHTATLAKAFGMEVIYYDIIPNPKFGCAPVSLDEVLKKSDFISLHLPRTPETENMISHEEFSKMQKGAFLVNCARGGIVDEKALYLALKEGEIAGAALDVFAKEPIDKDNILLTLDNIHFTPHLGANTNEAQIRAGTMAAQGILDVLAGKKPEFCRNSQVLE